MSDYAIMCCACCRDTCLISSRGASSVSSKNTCSSGQLTVPRHPAAPHVHASTSVLRKLYDRMCVCVCVCVCVFIQSCCSLFLLFFPTFKTIHVPIVIRKLLSWVQVPTGTNDHMLSQHALWLMQHTDGARVTVGLARMVDQMCL